MIDTVILNIARNGWGVHELDGEYPKWVLNKRNQGFSLYVKEPSSTMQESELYYPRVRMIERGYVKTLQFEFSIPKLLFGNNISEVRKSDFDEVIEVLKEKLLDFGIGMSYMAISQAEVSAVHYSKNFLITGGYTSTSVISELSKVNLIKRFDNSKTRFTNEGESLQFWTKEHSFVVYDKVSDLAKDSVRAIDKDQVPDQLSLFDHIHSTCTNPQILRIEVRITKKRKIRSVLKEYENVVPELKRNLTFKNLFNSELSQKLIQKYWQNLEKKEFFLYSLESNPTKLLQRFMKHDPSMTPKTAIYLLGLSVLANDVGGIRELRSLISTITTDRNWYRIASSFKTLNACSEECLHDWVYQIERQLHDYKTLKLSSLGVNNCKV